MKKGKYILLLIPALMFGAASCTYYQNPEESSGGGEIILPPPAYIGSSQCNLCHQEIYNTFINSGHPYKLPKVEDGVPPEYPFTELEYLPTHFENGWEDVSYVIGGFAWKYRFIDKNGYIYTGDDAQYNFQDSSVVAYHGDEAPGTKKYTCGKCHTTGWVSLADGGEPQDGLPGMDGEFFAGGIQCEACHGTGSIHAVTRSADDIIVDRSAEQCGTCHYRNEDHTIAASGGFIKHHEQYDEMIAAGHSVLTCIDCHDPHISVKHNQRGGIIQDCLDCHAGIKNQLHNGATCLDCHMPKATKTAVKETKYVGDILTHIFKINPAADGEMFNEDGTLANGETGVTLSYACYQCHKDKDGIGGKFSRKTLEQLSQKATGFHK